MPSAEPERRLTTYEDLLPGRNGGVGAPGISGEVCVSPSEPTASPQSRAGPQEIYARGMFRAGL